MTKRPPVSELEFLKLSGNHNELTRKLTTLAVPTPAIREYAAYVCEAWFRLAEEHLAESKLALAASCRRASLSRAYYAAYSASKSTRYIVQGSVSLRGDDHGKASQDLPGDFPDVAAWAQRITVLYENRLRADYDNWSATQSEFTLTPTQAVAEAESFVAAARAYLNSTYGIKV